MQKVYIYNTLGREKQKFQPINKNKITMYQCGPTVYWTQHIGNLRAMAMADLVVRTLKYIGYEVKLVRNYTDVGHLTSDADTGEDKMTKAANRETSTPEAIANKYTKIFEYDIKSLNISNADIKPCATQHISDMITMTQTLLNKGFAYTTDLAVYFNVAKVDHYTKLSNQNLDENIAQAGSGDVSDPNKKNPHDFALWFFKAGAHAHALQTWLSPFSSPLVQNGEGFPGWHIECSAMSIKYLGETIDIHMGGIEHIPVHHTNEIAQSESATGQTFAHYWLHNEHLTVDGGKMAKSEGTSFSLQDVIEHGFHPLALRYFFLQAHYRSKQNFTWEALTASQNALNKLYLQTVDLDTESQGKLKTVKDYKEKFIKAITDDFNIPQALAVVWELLKSKEKPAKKLGTLLEFDQILGLNIELKIAEIKTKLKNLPQEIQELLQQRQVAREVKNWRLSDELRYKIQNLGYWLEDTPEGMKIIPK